MPLWGRQYWYCPNCGAKYYSAALDSSIISALVAQCLNPKCSIEWEQKHARCILGINQTVERKKENDLP